MGPLDASAPTRQTLTSSENHRAPINNPFSAGFACHRRNRKRPEPRAKGARRPQEIRSGWIVDLQRSSTRIRRSKEDEQTAAGCFSVYPVRGVRETRRRGGERKRTCPPFTGKVCARSRGRH